MLSPGSRVSIPRSASTAATVADAGVQDDGCHDGAGMEAERNADQLHDDEQGAEQGAMPAKLSDRARPTVIAGWA